MGLFFGISLSVSGKESFDDDACHERGILALFTFVLVVEVDFQTVFLAILQKFAFEVHFFLCHTLQVNLLFEDAFFDKPECIFKASVKIDGAHECLEGVPCDEGIVGTAVGMALDEAFESDLLCNSSERFSADDFRTCVGEKSFTLVLEASVNDVADDCFEYGIAQKLQAFVVHRSVAGAFRLVFLRLMGEGYAVYFHIVGIESHDVIERCAELLVGLEKEFQPVNEITHKVEIRIYA